MEALRVQKPKSYALSAKYYNLNGLWALKPEYRGPWAVRVR